MTDWTARFITPATALDAAPLLRKEVALDTGHGSVENATLVLSALGVVEATINGSPASDALLTPGWTSYEWRLHTVEHDVTALVTGSGAGETLVIGLALGDGWHRGRLGWGAGATPYGTEIAGFAELSIRFADGHEQLVATDDTWTATAGATTADSIYDGQDIDGRRAVAVAGWNESGAAAEALDWSPVRVVDVDLDTFDPQIAPPVRRIREIAPVTIGASPSGRTLIDFGENIVGWLRVRVSGEAGTTITLRHAEVLEHDELGTRPLRAAKATDRFILSGGDDVFEPTSTFHGFRYAEVDGWPGGLAALSADPSAVTAVVISSDLRRIGHFASSDPLLDQLHENVVRGMQGNFVDVPTDCPQRDERLGWTGDIAAFAPTAAGLFDVKDFLRDWLRDLALEQTHHDGAVPFVVPDVLKYMVQPSEFPPMDSTAVWSDAAAWVPWALWQAYGDPVVLEEAFPSMAAHARRVRSKLSENGVWDTGFQFGDWLDPDASPDRPADAKADKGVVATASIYRTARIVEQAAGVLGREAERAEFAELADALKNAFHTVYVADERIHSDCTTVYSLAIAFDLLDPDELGWAGDRLAELVAESGFHISTGFAGTPFIADALSSTGHIDEAYRLLLQRECPSWLYPVTMGATTIWERWDSMLPDGTINPGEMTSFNHYALGAVADWLHRVVGGLAPLEPGYSRILVAPQPGGGLTWAETTLDTPHGLASVRWERSGAGSGSGSGAGAGAGAGAGDGYVLSVQVPEGVTAVVRAAGSADRELAAGSHTLTL